jgi:hypothetical protein
MIRLALLLLLGTTMAGFGSGPEKHQGVCWVAGRERIAASEMDKLVQLRVNWISQTPFGWQTDAGKPEIKFKFSCERMWWGESDSGLIETARLAHQRGIKTVLKPHLWAKSWPGDIAMKTQQDWTTWFNAYENFILHYAALAEQSRMDMFCIGTELTQTTSHESSWRNLIRKIRMVYHGPLTYAANFHEEFDRITFWDQLDYIGVQAYFPLTSKAGAPEKELLSGWRAPLAALDRIHTVYGKPILFTEIGYRNTSDAAIDPWRWPNEDDQRQVDNSMQADCYRAFFKAVWHQPWFAGAHFWKWYPGGSRHAVDFSPQNKPAESVLQDYFVKEL